MVLHEQVPDAQLVSLLDALGEFSLLLPEFPVRAVHPALGEGMVVQDTLRWHLDSPLDLLVRVVVAVRLLPYFG